MKNIQLFSCLLFTMITTQCMNEKNAWQKIDCSITTSALETDCQNYLKNRLEEYKKTNFTPQDMEEINFIAAQITGRKNILTYNNGHGIRDNEQNTFFHIAIRKADLPIVTWLLNNKCWTYEANAQRKEPLDLCIDQLLPTANNKNKQVNLNVLDTLMSGYDKGNFCPLYRRKFITKLIILQLEHKKYNNNFILKDSWINPFTTCSYCTKKNILQKCSSCIYLSDIYKTTIDTEKNTFSHILAQKQQADELYNFIQKEYISFSYNNNNQNPLNIAVENFISCIENDIDVTGAVSPTRCCLFMLLNYIKKQQGVIDFEQCCDKHII